MVTQEEFETLKSIYDQNVKPLIEKKAYLAAGVEMGNLHTRIEMNEKYADIKRYSHGQGLLASIEVLRDNLFRERVAPNEIKNLEMLFAQVGLSIKSNNVFREKETSEQNFHPFQDFGKFIKKVYNRFF